MFYRPEIDGLRTVAVMPVILYHAGFSWFSGGFIGVDIFFVISGYLITFLLLREIHQTNAISIANFYERRIRRILPALIIVSCASTAAAFFWLPPTLLENYGKALISTFLFVSNIYFWKNTGYFDVAAEHNPLLHTWSLAVEEQFYIFFPLLLIFLFRYARSSITLAISICALISFALAEYFVHKSQSAVFYLIIFRAWELLTGALCAIYLMRSNTRNNRSAISTELLSFLGFVFILTSIFFLDHTIPFPGLAALPSVLGTALVICFSANTIIGKLLSTKILVGIGLISYSLYLWHQPVFAFARMRCQCELNPETYYALICLCIVLAYLSWKYVEAPFRVKAALSRAKVYSICASLTAILAGFSLVVLASDGMRFRFNETVLAAAEVTRDPIHESCKNKRELSTGVDICDFGDLSAENTIVLLGDSHAGMLLYSFSEKLKEENKKGVYIINWNCHVIPGFIGNANHKSKLDECFNRQKDVLRYIQDRNASTVLIARWSFSIAPIEGYLTSAFFDNGKGGIERANASRGNYILVNGLPTNTADAAKVVLTDYLASLADASSRLTVVMPVPEVGWDVPSYNFQHYLSHGNLPEEITTPYEVYLTRNKFILETISNLSHPKIETVDPAELLCEPDRNVCLAQRNMQPLYYDDDHLNRAGAALLVEKIVLNLPQQE